MRPVLFLRLLAGLAGIAGAALNAAEAGDPVIVIPANTVVDVKLLESVGSKSSQPGDAFRLQVLKPVIVDGVVVIAADTPVSGEVVHAERSRFGGKAGELIVAPRYIELPGQRIRLRSSFAAVGADATNAALITGMVTAGIGGVIKGKETELPAGTILSTRVAAETPVSVAAGYMAVPAEIQPMSAGDVQ